MIYATNKFAQIYTNFTKTKKNSKNQLWKIFALCTISLLNKKEKILWQKNQRKICLVQF